MALWESMTEGLGASFGPNLLLGTVVVILAPLVLPATLAGICPLAKTLVKGGVLAYDTAREIIADADEHRSDLVAEVRAELPGPAAAPAPASSTIMDQRPRMRPQRGRKLAGSGRNLGRRFEVTVLVKASNNHLPGLLSYKTTEEAGAELIPTFGTEDTFRAGRALRAADSHTSVKDNDDGTALAGVHFCLHCQVKISCASDKQALQHPSCSVSWCRCAMV